MRFHGIAFVKWAFPATVALAALSVAATASADVSIGVDVGGPTYYQPQPAPAYVVPAEPAYVAPPPVYYQPAPPVYYQRPPPVYYPPPGYYAAPPPPVYQPAPGYGNGHGYGHGYAPAPSDRKLSDMQRRALDNCALLAPQQQPRCRATVMSTNR